MEFSVTVKCYPSMQKTSNFISLPNDIVSKITHSLDRCDALSLSLTCKTIRHAVVPYSKDQIEQRTLSKINRMANDFVTSIQHIEASPPQRSPFRSSSFVRPLTLGADTFLKKGLDQERSPTERAVYLGIFAGTLPFAVSLSLTSMFTRAGDFALAVDDFKKTTKAGMRRADRHDKRRMVRKELENFQKILSNLPECVSSENTIRALEPALIHLRSASKHENLRMRHPDADLECSVFSGKLRPRTESRSK